MATHHGKEGVVKIGANSVGEVVDFNVDENAAVVDDSAKGDDWDTHLAGRNSWSGSITCHWDPADTNGQEALTVGASVSLVLYPSGSGSGDAKLTGTATVTRRGASSPLEDVVSQTFDFQGNGALTHGTET
jgi:hypothetical protein